MTKNLPDFNARAKVIQGVISLSKSPRGRLKTRIIWPFAAARERQKSRVCANVCATRDAREYNMCILYYVYCMSDYISHSTRMEDDTYARALYDCAARVHYGPLGGLLYLVMAIKQNWLK